MKPQMIIFFIIVLAIYIGGNWYVFSRGLSAIEETSYTRLYSWVFWIMSLSFFIGQILERGNPGDFERIITYIGSMWLVVLLYSLIAVALIDLVRLLDVWFHFLPSPFIKGKWVFLTVLTITIVLTIGGYINALNPHVKTIELSTTKKLGQKELRIALLTDIHMGAIIQNHRVEKMVNMINKTKPDMILLAGDLVDHNPKPVIRRKMGEHFLKLSPPLGMYAVAGNHEFIGHPEVSIEYLSNYGIKYLRDTTVTKDFINIAGRDDRDKPRFSEGQQRKSLNEVISDRNNDLFTILMDHQPVEYDLAADQGIDLMVSGHTHKGQIWPFNYITNLVYENDYGLLKKGKSWFYTSSGFGTWGPPVRIGNRPELVLFIIKESPVV